MLEVSRRPGGLTTSWKSQDVLKVSRRLGSLKGLLTSQAGFEPPACDAGLALLRMRMFLHTRVALSISVVTDVADSYRKYPDSPF